MTRRTANICRVNNPTAQLLHLCQKATRQGTINKPALAGKNRQDTETGTDLACTWIQVLTLPSACICCREFNAFGLKRLNPCKPGTENNQQISHLSNNQRKMKHRAAFCRSSAGVMASEQTCITALL